MIWQLEDQIIFAKFKFKYARRKYVNRFIKKIYGVTLASVFYFEQDDENLSKTGKATCVNS